MARANGWRRRWPATVRSCPAAGSVFQRVESGELQIAWLDRDTAMPTRRIFNVVIWLFALAMTYPYLPGAHTAAFQGVSVLVGLMVSMIPKENWHPAPAAAPIDLAKER